jgi:hypothetical protein
MMPQEALRAVSVRFPGGGRYRSGKGATRARQPRAGRKGDFLMNRLLTIALGIAFAIGLGGCDTIGGKITDAFNYAQQGAAKETAAAVDTYCANLGGNIERRKQFVDAVNAQTKRGDIFAFDCDSDHVPDFKAEVELAK